MNREELPNRCECETFKVKVGSNSWFVTLDYYPDGRLGGISLKTARAGSELNDMMHTTGIFASLALQRGATRQEITAQFDRAGEGHVFRAISSVLKEAR